MLPGNQMLLLRAGIGLRCLKRVACGGVIVETSSIRAVRDLIARPEMWILTLLGHHGVGKTFAGEWLILEAIREKLAVNDGSAKLLTPFELLEAMHRAESRQHLRQVGVLVLDDLGCENSREMALISSALFDIINARWKNMKKTMLTSNLSPKAFLHRYGRRVTGRLRDGKRCVAVTGADLRLEKVGSGLDSM